MTDSAIRFSVDVGGTFTDIVVLDEGSGEFHIDKVSTTPDNTIKGVLDAISKVGIELGAVARFFVHGSTTALNTLLEGKGVRTAYVTTKGFRDVPEIGRYSRPDMYNAKYKKPAQLVPRQLRFEVVERSGAKGEVVTPLDEGSARAVAAEIRAAGVQAVAICLLHAHRNPSHEERLKQILMEELPGLAVALSSSVAPEHREFERAMTTILNAYLSPIVERWLNDLEQELRSRGFEGEVVLTKSDGGGMTPDAAKRSPINMLLSGPAGGVIGGVHMASAMERPNLITMDVGGTSFDVALIKNGRATTQQQTQVNRYPILISALDIRTIGAGGGSLAWIDAGGALHVGPQSAAAKPGPICYRLGGTQPTTTDAFVVNGYIDPDNFLGGQMRLDVEGATRGIRTQVAEPLKLSLHDASSGILRIATANMSEAVKSIASESGDDLRDFGMLCFGGGGALFGAFIMDELELPAAIVPIVPSVFSAWGMLMVDLQHDLVSTHSIPLSELTDVGLRSHFGVLTAKGDDLLAREGVPEGRRRSELYADMRYSGQEHTVSVRVTFDLAAADLRARLQPAFEESYRAVYGYKLGLPTELVNLRVKAIGTIPAPQVRQLPQPAGPPMPTRKGRRKVYDFIFKQWETADVYGRAELARGATLHGPALVEEATTTTVVRTGQMLVVDPFGNLIVTRKV
jgi:N-methylhydantoinase A